jgi:hypothetical protein
MALPNIQNNSTEIVDVLQTSMDINLDIFSFLEKYAEKQVKILQEILTVIKKQYEFNVDWRRDEEYQREELDREKPNPPSTPEPSVGDDAGDAGDDAGGSGGSGGFGLLGALGSGLSITKLITTFKNIFRVIGKFTIFGTIIFAIIDFITGFIDKFKAADSLGEGILEGLWGGITNAIRGIIAIPLDMLKDLTSWIAEKLGFSEVAKVLDSFSFVDLFNKATEWLYNTETDTWFGGALDDLDSLGESILEGLWGGYTNVIRDFIYIPLDMLKDLTSWIAEKLGFSEVAKVLDSFSFVDLFDKATKWLYDTETNIWFGGALDDLPEKMKTLYTDLKTKLESFIKDYIYDGSGDKIKLFGQELPNMTDIIQFGTEMKIKLTEFVKNNIYDGSGDKIKLFGQELPNMTDIANFGTEIKTKLESFIKDYIYDPETGSILGINFGDLFKKLDDMLPDMDDIIGQLLAEVPEFFVPDEMKALRAKAIQKNEAEDAAKETAKAEADQRAKDTTTAAMSFLGSFDETETFKNNTTQQTSSPTTSTANMSSLMGEGEIPTDETTSSIPTTPASKVETKQLSLKEIKKQESKLYYEKYKDMSISQLNKIIQEGSNLTVTERQFVSDLQLLKSKENNTRVYKSQSTKFEAKYGIMLSDKTSNTSDSNTTSNTSDSKIIPSTTPPVTGAAVESGSQAVNEMNSQAPNVNVVSDSSSKVNAPVTSTVVNYTPGSSNARNSDNSVRQFSINALSGL